jgi:hypothetical protein
MIHFTHILYTGRIFGNISQMICLPEYTNMKLYVCKFLCYFVLETYDI